MRIVLASASPRRRELLAAAGVRFSIEPSAVDEEAVEGLAPEELALELARRKARAVAAKHGGADYLVLGADTVVAVGEGARTRLLGKPAGAEEARAMLRELSGTRHRVVTGVCAVRASDGASAEGFERTWVTMRTIHPEEMEVYVASDEWQDKAGGYAIQETADAFVVALEEGGFDNVVGLPVALTLRMIAALSPDGGSSAGLAGHPRVG